MGWHRGNLCTRVATTQPANVLKYLGFKCLQPCLGLPGRRRRYPVQCGTWRPKMKQRQLIEGASYGMPFCLTIRTLIGLPAFPRWQGTPRGFR